MSHLSNFNLILSAARLWRIRCLEADGSILSVQLLWTIENLDQLARCVDHSDVGDVAFLSRLETQLGSAPPATRQLAAEVLWILYLMVSDTALSGGTKRFHIRRVWEWSGESLLHADEMLARQDGGLVNPGPAFHTHRRREFAFVVVLARDFKSLPILKRDRLLSDPWRFASWIDEHPASPGRQFRHMLLYLLFPNQFERVVTTAHKEAIARAFTGQFSRDPRQVEWQSRVAVDRAIFELRPALKKRYGREGLDFYLEPLRSVWIRAEDTHKRGDTTPSPSRPTRALDAPWGNARVWVIAAGERARLWPQLREQGKLAIGWDYLGDLSVYGSREDVHNAIREYKGGNPSNDSLACWQYSHVMRPGDHVLVKQGRFILLGHGVVRSDYRYDADRTEYTHVRDAEWLKVGRWELPPGSGINSKTLTRLDEDSDFLQNAFSLLYGAGIVDDPPASHRSTLVVPHHTTVSPEREAFASPETLRQILDALARKKNVVLEGAPGVGKSFVARRIAYALLNAKDDSRVEMVQFHQSYSYEDFVQGYRPDGSGGFALRDGIFHRFCRRAGADPDNAYVFIVDEINRGNLSRILGELMLLIEADKRGPRHAIPLTYSRTDDERFHVPPNVHLLGLMNTADRSLAMVDYALRRRFTFIRLEPAFETEGFTNALSRAGVPDDVLKRIIERMGRLNEAIRADRQHLGRDYEVGHSFFVPDPDSDTQPDGAWYEQVVRLEIAPLLREYWPDQPGIAEGHIRRLLDPA